MTATLEFFEDDGVTSAAPLDWGMVRPGDSGTSLTRVLKNTGDEPAVRVVLGIETVGALDLEQWMTGTTTTGTFTQTSPLTLGNLAAGASVTLTFDLAVPDGAPESSLLLAALPYADWG